MTEAKNQMAIDLPQLILVRISPDWIADPNFTNVATATFKQFVARNKKINAVVAIWEVWVELEGTQRAQLIKYRVFTNATPAYICPDIRDLGRLGERTDESLVMSFGSFG